jgi:hypothetical protein
MLVHYNGKKYQMIMKNDDIMLHIYLCFILFLKFNKIYNLFYW